MNIKILPAYDFPEEIKLLFSEYTDILIEGDPSFKEYLEIQNYDDELKTNNFHIFYGLRKI